MRIGLLNGPNLNLLGIREPAVYGTTTLAQVEDRLRELAQELGFDFVAAQFNGEGQMIDQLHEWRGKVDGVVVNAGAYTHTSLALRDAFSATSIPFVEIHISNVYAREVERHHSMLAGVAIGAICGLGVDGYEYALRGLVTSLRSRR
ncbi:MAG: type II 3-dehydroquinate dehydratase [Gemmatimonadaceae bacterium]